VLGRVDLRMDDGWIRIDYRPEMNFGAQSESPLKWTKCNPVVLFRELMLLARNSFQGVAGAEQIDRFWIRSIDYRTISIVARDAKSAFAD
jgi:hypothetical protein